MMEAWDGWGAGCVYIPGIATGPVTAGSSGRVDAARSTERFTTPVVSDESWLPALVGPTVEDMGIEDVLQLLILQGTDGPGRREGALSAAAQLDKQEER